METLYDFNIPTSFSGINTGKGFVSLYDSIFPEDRLNGLYIIKGGPGTGKSTFMRKLGTIALTKGFDVEHYLCGSDAQSLDGIIIRGDNGAVGVIDGTSPHPREFRSPGAAGDILNFGTFWNSNSLRSNRLKIDLLVNEKKSCFDTAYKYLGATEKIARHVLSLAEEFYVRDKAYAAATRLVSAVGTKGNLIYKQLSGYTMNGHVTLEPDVHDFSKYRLRGNDEIARLFLYDLKNIILKNNISAEISHSPLNMQWIDGIYFPESRVWVSVDSGTDDIPDKVINMKRFIDNDTALLCRQRLRFGRKCRESLLKGAFESLMLAKKYHFALEDIYKAHMNFEELNYQSEKWYKEILSRLD